MTSSLLPNGVSVSRNFNNANQLQSIIATKSATTLSTVSYGLDNVGNRLSRTDGSGTANYSYDELYRLTAAAYPDATSETFTYDASGNRLTLNDGTATTNYTYDAIDRMTVAGATNYTHDKKGNRLTAGNRSFTYDTESRLLQIADWPGTPGSSCADVNGDGTVNLSDAVAVSTANGKSAGHPGYTYEKDVNRSGTIDLNDIIQIALRMGQNCTVKGTYAYNADGLRVYAAEGTSVVNSVWDVTAAVPVVVQEVGGRSYVYGSELVSQTEAGGSSSHPLQDGIGSTVALTDSAGAVVSTTTYQAFGGVNGTTGVATTTFGYTGQQTDATGLIYLRARYYDPSTGRFVTPDLVPGSTLSTQSLNRFVCVENNPILLVDPKGEWGHVALMALGGALIQGGGELASQVLNGEEINIKKIGAASLGGATTYGLIGLGVNPLIAGAAGGAVESVAYGAFEGRLPTVGEYTSTVAIRSLSQGLGRGVDRLLPSLKGRASQMILSEVASWEMEHIFRSPESAAASLIDGLIRQAVVRTVGPITVGNAGQLQFLGGNNFLLVK
jgi:RHS repeat-associated protein